jgi:hypothetical protein
VRLTGEKPTETVTRDMSARRWGYAASPPRRDLARQAATSRLSLVASRAAVPPLPRAQRSVVYDPEGATRGTELTVGVGLRNEADDVPFPAQSKTNNSFLVALV